MLEGLWPRSNGDLSQLEMLNPALDSQCMLVLAHLNPTYLCEDRAHLRTHLSHLFSGELYRQLSKNWGHCSSPRITWHLLICPIKETHQIGSSNDWVLQHWGPHLSIECSLHIDPLKVIKRYKLTRLYLLELKPGEKVLFLQGTKPEHIAGRISSWRNVSADHPAANHMPFLQPKSHSGAEFGDFVSPRHFSCIDGAIAILDLNSKDTLY
ncbi:hypothetical protein NE237_011922 [Protea cynaroides]|uniref:Uncharacterized protein n=1 Tax=Protea cynaroides TaxID=273540 RepID=A0A9Q0GX08_9MAGN|nr:hypothetical protein NE237_011922 [Protea cynaroides]